MSRMATSTRSGAGGGTEPLTRRCSKKVISGQILSGGGSEGRERRISPCTAPAAADWHLSNDRSRRMCPRADCVLAAQDLFSRFGLPDDQVHHVAQVLSLLERRQLPVGAG